MRPLGALLCLPLLTALACCGGRTAAGSGTEPSAAPCAGTALGHLSVGGAPETVRLRTGRLCAGGASVSARGLALDPSTARRVRLHTGDSVLLVHGGVHPGGGYQPWLVAAGDGALRLLRAGDGSVLPAVAADGGGAPTTATCTPDGFAVWAATTHQPPGVVLAWDVRRTTYTLHGTRLTTGPTRLVENGTADPTLRKTMAQLFDPGSTFSDC